MVYKIVVDVDACHSPSTFAGYGTTFTLNFLISLIRKLSGFGIFSRCGVPRAIKHAIMVPIIVAAATAPCSATSTVSYDYRASLNKPLT